MGWYKSNGFLFLMCRGRVRERSEKWSEAEKQNSSDLVMPQT